ncbi:hypothetical protein DNTS_002950 [Danionella cerebrum]|uniref:SHSP domain-containing protein n=1 Tax=Danionella cerebrum TaxID=2873325 RepID=A0A553P9E3_9TELE|nr:hypothetical protein DNTS_002950 [Danionella translucida]
MEIPSKSSVGSEGQDSETVSEQREEQNWKICLDVRLFSPEEISIKTKDGYLEITGNHEERQDNHRFVSRSFTRKYKLPANLNLNQISPKLSADGRLSIEAPEAGSKVCIPGEILIPIHKLDKQLPADPVELNPPSDQ